MEWWCHAVARAVSVSLVSFFLLPVHYGAAAQLTKVRISYSSRSNSNTPFIIALNKGFFAEEGMDVEIIQVNLSFRARARNLSEQCLRWR